MRLVKIGEPEYKAMKALAKERGQFLQFVINEAIRAYLKANKKP
jgi:hypothetical protein